MATIITYPSALEYWLSEAGIPYYFHFDPSSARVKNQEVLEADMSRAEIIRSTEMLNFAEPVHVAVSNHIKRTAKEQIIFHKLPNLLPEHSFYKIEEGVYMIGPELCFIQAGMSLPLPEQVLLGNELCAIYIKDAYENYGQRRRTPATTAHAITTFINSAKHLQGLTQARTAAQYVLDCSNSPVESRLAVPSALPLFRGGYGLIKPQLNLDIKLALEAADYLGRPYCCCDMVWKDQKVVLEYDSNLTHLSIEQHFLDKKRATALTISGYKVMSITAEQIQNFSNIERTFLRVRDLLNMKTHQSRLDMYYEKRRKLVESIILQPLGKKNKASKFEEDMYF